MIPYFTAASITCFTDLVTFITYRQYHGPKHSQNQKKDSLSLRLPYGSSNASSPKQAIIFRRCPLQSPRERRCWVHFWVPQIKTQKNCLSFNLRTWASCWCFITISAWKPIFTNFTFRIYVGEIILPPNPRGPRLQTSDEHPKFPTNNSHGCGKKKTSTKLQGWELLTSRYSVYMDIYECFRK